MVAQLLRLRVDLLVGEVRSSPRRTTLVVLGSLLGLAAALVMAVAIGGLHDASAPIARRIVVPVGALVTLGFTLVPLVVGGSDQLDPRRFLTFGLERRDVAVGVAVAGLVGLPTVGVAILAVAQVGTWGRGVGTAVLAVVAAVLIVATTALLARVAATVGAGIPALSRTRDVAWLVVVLVVVLLVPAFALLYGTDRTARAGGTVERLADVAAWTPWGAAWAVPADAAAGHVGSAVGELAVALVVLGLLGLAWWALLGRLDTAVELDGSGRRHRAMGWFDRLGSTPVGAVAARSMTYWGRDPRYRTSYLVLVVIPLVVLPLGVAGVPWNWTALVPLPLMAIGAGFLPHNDVAYDNTAVWMQVASGAPGWSDRLGRVTPMLVVGVPALVVGAVVSAGLFGDWGVLPVLLGVSGCALLSGLGLSSIWSALLPYPTVRPGDHPFQQPQAPGVLAATAQSTMLLGTLLLMVPAVLLGLRALSSGDGDGAVSTLLVGLGIGVVVLVLGVLVGGRLFDRSGPDILAVAQRT